MIGVVNAIWAAWCLTWAFIKALLGADDFSMAVARLDKHDRRHRSQREPRAWSHSQDLSKDLPPGKRWGGKIRHGRCWLHWYLDAAHRRSLCFNAEWMLLSGKFCLKLDLGGGDCDDGVQLIVGCGLFTLYLSLEGLSGLGVTVPGAEIGIDFHHGSIWLDVWSRPDEWRRRDPWWRRQIVLHVADWLFGKVKYASRIITRRDCLIPMPEGSYKGKAELFESTWRRSHWWAWWLTVTKIRCTVDVEGHGIPIEGKGENSWDCGPDAVRGLTSEALTIEDGIGNLVSSVLETRRKRGGGHLFRDQQPVLA